MLFPYQTPSKIYAVLLIALAIGQYYLAQQFLLPALLIASSMMFINGMINAHYQFQNTERFQNVIINTFTGPKRPKVNKHLANLFANTARELDAPLSVDLNTKEYILTYKSGMVLATFIAIAIEAAMIAIIYYGFQYLTGHDTLQSLVLIYAVVRPALNCLNRVPTKYTQFTEQINRVFFDAVGKRLSELPALATDVLAESIDTIIARGTRQTNPADALYAKTIIQYFEQFQANTQIDPSTPNQLSKNPTPQELQQYTLSTLRPRIRQLQKLYPNT